MSEPRRFLIPFLDKLDYLLSFSSRGFTFHGVLSVGPDKSFLPLFFWAYHFCKVESKIIFSPRKSKTSFSRSLDYFRKVTWTAYRSIFGTSFPQSFVTCWNLNFCRISKIFEIENSFSGEHFIFHYSFLRQLATWKSHPWRIPCEKEFHMLHYVPLIIFGISFRKSKMLSFSTLS